VRLTPIWQPLRIAPVRRVPVGVEAASAFAAFFCVSEPGSRASRKKNDAYYRQGQVVQQRQGLRVH
jgi:hypothetical protein